ncbi:MAG: TolC family protein [Bacteroidia bacterium]|nr:TolC family protein [Bacteroidia bacterium]
MELNILEQAANAYYMALLGKASMQLNADLLASNDSLLQIAQVRLDNGVIEPLEFNRIKTLYLESSQRWQESSNSYAQQLGRLKVLCGLEQRDSLEILQEIDPQYAGTVTLQATASGTPRHKALSLQAGQRHAELKKQQLRVAPELSLFARYTRQAQRNEFNFFSQQGDWFDIALIGVRADWNLFTGFNRQASIQQASYQARAAELELADADLRKEQELENLRQNYLTAATGLRTYATHYQLSKENYALATHKYQEGVYTLDQYITITRKWCGPKISFSYNLPTT